MASYAQLGRPAIPRSAPRVLPGLGGARPTSALLRAIQAGDEDAFRDLYERYHWRAYRDALSLLGDAHEAENIAHEVFLAAWKALPDMEPDVMRFGGWIVATTRNLVRTHVRTHRRIDVCEVGELHDLLDEAYGRLAEIDGSQGMSHDELRRLMAGLSESQRDVLLLRFREDLSFEQIAARLGCTPQAAKKTASRALKNLRTRMGPLAADRRQALPMRRRSWASRRMAISGFTLLRRAA